MVRVLLFTAEWCQPCKLVKPILKELAEEYGFEYREIDLDKDKDALLAAKYEVAGIPCAVFLNGDEVVDIIHGVEPKAFYRRIIENKLGLGGIT